MSESEQTPTPQPAPEVHAILIPESLVRGATITTKLASCSELCAGFAAPTAWHVTKLPAGLGYFARRDPSETYLCPGGALAGQLRHAWRDAGTGDGRKLGTRLDIDLNDE